MTNTGIRKAIYQRDGLASLLQEDEFLLIILDACRWDTLQHFIGKQLTMALSPAPLTVRWLKACWPATYDVSYIAANPHLVPEDRPQHLVNYDGEQHFEDLVYLGDDAWDDDLGTYPPAPLRDATINTDNDRMITHFIQPHVPFIGDDAITGLEYQSHGYDAIPDSVPASDIRKAYYGNLRRVWDEGVRPLLREYEDRRVVVTADHGELLGENGDYGHGVYAYSVLFVPWVEFPAGTLHVPEPADINWAADLPKVIEVLCYDYVE